MNSSQERCGALRLGGEFGVRMSGSRVERGLRVPRQQGFELLGRLGLRKFLKQMAQVGVGLDAIGAAGHDDRIQIGAGFGTDLAVYEKPGTPSDGKGLIWFSQ
jgi:hypothetical protein